MRTAVLSLIVLLSACSGGGQLGAPEQQPAAPASSPAPPPAPTPSPVPPPTGAVVFVGDSITHLWKDAPGVNAGINGNTTAQMLERFQADVLSKRPAVVVILGGTNDIFLDLVPEQRSLDAMADMASAAGACVILGTLPPLYVTARQNSTIEESNELVFRWNIDTHMLASAHAYRVADYHAVLDGHPELFDDGLHPSTAGYEVMRRVVQPEIDACMGRQ